VLRSWARERAFFGVAVVTLALGLALTTTIFSVADNLLYRPLPYPEPDRLYELSGAARVEGQFRIAAAAGDYLDWRDTGVFTALGAYKFNGALPIAGGAEPHRVNSAAVDSDFFTALGVPPMLGRAISPDDCRPGSAKVALMSAALWRADFGADQSVVGRIVDIAGARTQIVGVLAADFLFPATTASSQGPSPIELLVPLSVPDADRRDHNARIYRVIGRLAHGVDVREAQERLDAVQRAARPLYRPGNVRPGAFDGVTMSPLSSSITPQSAQSAVLFLLIASLAVLLVAAVNIANMLLARGSDRERELAIRAAIGASRSQLVRLLLVESVTLGLLGGLLGLVLARVSFGAVLTQLPVRFTDLRGPKIDLRVAAFAWGISVLLGIVFGLLPAFRLSKTDFASVAKQPGSTSAPSTRWLRDVLIAVEMALAVMLIGAGALVLRSFANVVRVDTGMDVRHVLTLQIAPPARIARGTVEDGVVFFRSVLGAAQGVSGVQAALTDNLLMMNAMRGSSLLPDGASRDRVYGRGSQVTEIHVSPDYFRVMGIPIQRGTAFPSSLHGDEAVAIVADRLGRVAGVDPLGRELRSLMKGDTRQYRVIGVVPDSRESAVELDPMSSIYLPFTAEGPTTLVVRAVNPIAMIAPLTRAIHAAEPDAIVDHVRTLDDLVRQSTAERRFNAFLYGAFSASAVVLSMIGVYGVIAYSVGRRTREIGIRIALGAPSTRVVSLVTLRVVVAVACGLCSGLVGLITLQSSMRTLVFGVAPTDPSTLTIALLLITGTGLIAAYIPTRRATRVDPMIALRSE